MAPQALALVPSLRTNQGARGLRLGDRGHHHVGSGRERVGRDRDPLLRVLLLDEEAAPVWWCSLGGCHLRILHLQLKRTAQGLEVTVYGP